MTDPGSDRSNDVGRVTVAGMEEVTVPGTEAITETMTNLKGVKLSFAKCTSIPPALSSPIVPCSPLPSGKGLSPEERGTIDGEKRGRKKKTIDEEMGTNIIIIWG